MKRLFFLPLISAMIGAGIVVGVLAAAGDLGKSTTKVVTEVQSQPIAPSNASNSGTALTPHEIYEHAAPGVVYVSSSVVRKVESPFNPFGETQRGTDSGSGIVINGNGLILTNWHVVENAVKVTVSFKENGAAVEAKVVGKNPSDDLALLKVPTNGLTLHPLKLGDSSAVQVGDPVLAIGNPFNLEKTLTTGVVSALQRHITSPNGFTITNVIQTDAPINPGNSGGPLLNGKGEVIGINSQIETSGGSDGNIGIGFAVPINTAKQQLPQLEKGGTVSGAYLGVETISITGALAGLNLPVKEGALVTKVQQGTAAAKAGIHGGDVEAQTQAGAIPLGGDIIVGIAGTKVKSAEQLGELIDKYKPGDKVKVELLRPSGEGKYSQKTVEATLSARPNSNPSASTSEGGSSEEG
ncbi:MAG: trypsin-like peptidase domain-containing protein [Solirubrobacteraceae bacterium]